ncbi:MAG: hypothetical protein WCI34_07690, partial [Actinomycetes bacterium]
LTQSRSASISISAEEGATFSCSVDGGDYSACSTPKSLSGLADGLHSLAVKAIDALGNTGSAATASWTVDTTPPAAPVLSGAPDSLTKHITAAISASAEDGASLSCSVDGGDYLACSSPVALSGLADGAHSLAVKATDAAGNTGSAATASWTVDTTPPAAPVLNGAPASFTKSRSASISISGETGATFACSVDGGEYSACTSPLAITDLADGLHSLAVKAIDVPGNTGSPKTVSWTVDTTAPAAPVVTGVPSPATVATSVTAAISGEPGATFACSVDSAAYTACGATLSATNLSLGEHVIRVEQTDLSGNTSEAATRTWSVVVLNAPRLLSKVGLSLAPKTKIVTLKLNAAADRSYGISNSVSTIEYYNKLPRPKDSAERNLNFLVAYGTTVKLRAGQVACWLRVRDNFGKWSTWYRTQP